MTQREVLEKLRSEGLDIRPYHLDSAYRHYHLSRPEKRGLAYFYTEKDANQIRVWFNRRRLLPHASSQQH